MIKVRVARAGDRTVATRVLGLRPVRTCDTVKPAPASRACVASISVVAQAIPHSERGGDVLGTPSGVTRTSTIRSSARKNSCRRPSATGLSRRKSRPRVEPNKATAWSRPAAWNTMWSMPSMSHAFGAASAPEARCSVTPTGRPSTWTAVASLRVARPRRSNSVCHDDTSATSNSTRCPRCLRSSRSVAFDVAYSAALSLRARRRRYASVVAVRSSTASSTRVTTVSAYAVCPECPLLCL